MKTITLIILFSFIPAFQPIAIILAFSLIAMIVYSNMSETVFMKIENKLKFKGH